MVRQEMLSQPFGENEVAAAVQAAVALEPVLPTELDAKFRTAIMGNGNVSAFSGVRAVGVHGRTARTGADE